ncbi:MAG TPA: hypothetical protein VM055_02895 [Novosphingobium sp.]|nr:hypothetical protein [Novosphingobium sp.]
MGEYIAVLAIVMSLSIPFFAIWTKHRKEVMQMQVNLTAEKAAQYAASNAANNRELEDRMRVLERIVTDKGYDVATQIEALRDARRTEALIDARELEERS